MINCSGYIISFFLSFDEPAPHGRYDEWQNTFGEWQKENPDKASLLQDGVDKKTPSVEELMAAIPEFDQDKDMATRAAGEIVLQVCFDVEGY